MDVISIKEFAQNRGVTYEAVRKQVAKYEEELRDHIVKRGRVQYLDEYAQKFLIEHRRLSPVVVKIEDSQDAVKELEETVETLRAKLLEAQNELLNAQKRVIELQDKQSSMIEEKLRYEALIEDHEALKTRISESEARETAAQETIGQLRVEIDTREEAHRAELEQRSEDLATMERERDEAKKEADSYQKTWFGLYRKK